MGNDNRYVKNETGDFWLIELIFYILAKVRSCSCDLRQE